MAERNARPRTVKLYSGPVSVTGPHGRTIDASAIVRIAWVPEPVIECEISAGAGLINATLDGQATEPWDLLINMGRRGTVSVTPYRWTFPRGGRDAQSGAVVQARVVPCSVGSGDRLSAVAVDLVNLDAVRGTVTLEGGPWQLTLSRLPHSHQLRLPGYYLTHHVLLERGDGGSFTADDAAPVLEAITFFGAFAEGGWPGLLRPVGRSAAGRVRWQRWEATGGDEASRHRSWLPHSTSTAAFGAGWPGFWQRWQRPEGQAAIRALLPIYVEAAHMETAEARLVLDQVGLELLSWIVVVEEQGMLSGEGHDKLTAADRIRLLLTNSHIDLAVPATLAALANAAPKGAKWADGAHAVTEVRNAAAHPRKRRNLRLAAQATEEAGTLAHSYLQRGLLSYFSYAGEYSNAALRSVATAP